MEEQKKKVIFYQPESVIVHHEETSRSNGVVKIDYERNRTNFKEKWGAKWEHLLWQVVS